MLARRFSAAVGWIIPLAQSLTPMFAPLERRELPDFLRHEPCLTNGLVMVVFDACKQAECGQSSALEVGCKLWLRVRGVWFLVAAVDVLNSRRAPVVRNFCMRGYDSR